MNANNKKVTVVAHPTTGKVITQSQNNPEFGTFRVDTQSGSFNNGFFQISRRTAFIRGRIKDLEALNLQAGMELPGQIIKKESFAPFYEGQEPKKNPSTGENVLTNGQETYLEYQYTTDMSMTDVWIDEPVNATATV